MEWCLMKVPASPAVERFKGGLSRLFIRHFQAQKRLLSQSKSPLNCNFWKCQMKSHDCPPLIWQDFQNVSFLHPKRHFAMDFAKWLHRKMRFGIRNYAFWKLLQPPCTVVHTEPRRQMCVCLAQWFVLLSPVWKVRVRTPLTGIVLQNVFCIPVQWNQCFLTKLIIKIIIVTETLVR